jgi:outer membrane receptor protein involved in Fe transport
MSMNFRGRILSLALALAAAGGPAWAQGSQTGTLTGRVESTDGAALPGVTVTATSPLLQGERVAVTTENGDYIFKGLPTGSYKVTFTLASFATVERTVTVELAQTSTVNATMSVASVSETITVTSDAPSALETPQGGATYSAREIDSLATGRTLVAIAELAPGLTDNTPNSGQVTISGGFAYDNVFLVDGVDVTDSTFGSPNNVFIEEAIQETQVITSGVSAEFGRFGGGVVNAITKRGGNEFSGSFRADLTNTSWRDETPIEDEQEIEREDRLGKVFQGTLGGPVLRDRLWFFVAGRTESRALQGTFPFSGVAFQDERDDKRFEGKLTGTIAPNHTLQTVYTVNRTEDSAPTFDFSIAPSTLDVTKFPQELFVVNYNGVLRPDLFLEAQYSQQSLGFRDGNGVDTDVATGSPIFTFGNSAAVESGQHYNAPYFDYGTDPQDRDNKQFTTNLSYFLSTASLGKHDLKAGVEYYRNRFKGGNSQSPTSFVYYADYKTDDAGNPVLDGNGNLTPVFEPFGGLFLNWIAERGAVLNVNTTTLYLNDRWQLNDHWAFNLGLRYEQVRSDTTSSDILALDTNTIVPRLAAEFDVKGDGRFKLQGTYSHYGASYNLSQFGNNQGAGNPSLVYALYVGPPGEGLGFAPGFDPQNYFLLDAFLPTANASFEDSLSSPLVKEWTLAAGGQFGNRGYGKVMYTNRRVTDFVESFTTIDLGTVEVSTDAPCLECAGPFLLDNIEYRNTSVPTREYQALQFLASYRLTDRWSVGGHYTYQIRNHGNFEGENTNQPAISSAFGDYPEILVPERNVPEGRLNDYQQHKVRAWTNYDLGLGGFGNLNMGVLWRYDSALTHSFASANQEVTEIQLSRDPGYAQPPQLQTVFFGERGSGSFAGAHLFDLALTYDIKTYKSFRPYVKMDVRNLFNDKTLGAGVSGWNTSVAPDFDGPVDANGIPTQFVRGPNFGRAIDANSFPFPREIRVALGFRF